MGEKKFTSEQLKAINTKGKTLLVSAAAGSGKTATLIERIIRSLLDEKNPEDISEILIVTFTNAAVAEIKSRISKALKSALESSPENETLSRQLMLLPTAKICTIDSFCNEILRRNADKVGIAPNYRIAETAESEILSRSILSALINNIYEDSLQRVASAEEFSHLADALTASKHNSELEEVFLKLYEKSKSNPEGVLIFNRLKELYENEAPEDNRYTNYALSALQGTSEHYYASILKILPELSESVYFETASSDIALMQNLIFQDTYSDAKKALSSLSYARLPSSKGARSEVEDDFKYLRADMKEKIQQISENFFSYSPSEWSSLYKELSSTLSVLYRFLAEFDRIYTEEKKKRAMLEYSDIERYTYLVLYENGSPSDIARSIRAEFSSVYIDEYQDVNALQNKIFEAVSTEKNRFMVGDIKQSIYAFRSADPDIFAQMKNSFPRLCDAENSSTASIFMSQNFRSDRGIIDFANMVFDELFPLCAESIGYQDEDSLIPSKLYENAEPKYRKPEITLISSERNGIGEEYKRKKDFECELVAKRIAQLLSEGQLNDGSAIKPSDIAVIMRGGKSRMADYARALESYGIPSEESDSKDFFLSSTILLALSLLCAIDNPQKDIYLAAIMLSPIFSFTPDELYLIREKSQSSLYESLKKYTEEHPDFKKGKQLLERLERYRTLSEGMNIDTFLIRLYNDTGLLSLAEKSGGKENLLLLQSYAKKFSSSKLTGLYNFIKFINNIISSNTRFDTKRERSGADAVSIMSVHASKGLEYPIVFYVDTDSSLGGKDSRDRIAFSEKFGLSLRLRSPSGLALVNNPVHNIILDFNAKKSFEEELRIMYVALTRPKERLYIYAAIPDNDEEFFKKADSKRKFLSKNSMYSLTSAIDIILASGAGADIGIIKTPPISEGVSNLTTKKESAAPDFEMISKDELSTRLSFSYPHQILTTLPEKMSISKLYPELLDEVGEAVSLKLEKEETPVKKRGILPEFITGKASDESAKKGIATHSFMQFFSLDELSKNGAEEELERLVEKGFLSKDDAARVRLKEIENFKYSKLFNDIQLAKSLYREFRFTTLLPARYFTDDKEKKAALKDTDILVQGVIDCLYEDADGEFHLVDYKTDRLSKAELADRALADEVLREKHKLQLSYYSLAVKNIFGKEPKDIKIYSTVLSDTVDVQRVVFE